MIVAITGASGFIGRRLAARLETEGHAVRAVPRGGDVPDGVDAVVHLAGEPVAQRWTEEAKRRIQESRVAGTRRVVDAIGRMARKPAVLVSASAIGFYGDRGDEVLTERSAPGADFLAKVCGAWEAEARRAESFGVPVTVVRFGIVLGVEGGALKQMLTPFRAGVGGPAGSGKQWVSWIHADDAVRMILLAIERQQSTTWNATAPLPVRNAEFASELGKALGRPAVVPTPAFALKLMFGEMAKAVLSSQRVLPEAATGAGFRFTFENLRAALSDVLRTA